MESTIYVGIICFCLGMALVSLLAKTEEPELPIPFGSSTKVNNAFVCLDCDEIFSERENCPKCLSKSMYRLRNSGVKPINVPNTKETILKLQEERIYGNSTSIAQTQKADGESLSTNFVDNINYHTACTWEVI